MISFAQGQCSVLTTNQKNNLIYENGLLRLDDTYKQAICNVYTIEGKLIFTKQIGVSTIPTQQLSTGIYFLQPINTDLKAFKFAITH